MSLCAGDVACECQAIFQIVFGWLCDLNRGNWWGHAPYKHGAPCSACPPSYGGGCKDNLCYKGRRKCVLKGKLPKCLMCVDVTICDVLFKGHNTHLAPEEREENNFIEPEAPRTTQKIRPRVLKPETPSLPAPDTETPADDLPKNEVVNTQQMCTLP